MSVFRLKTIVGFQRIRVQRRASLDDCFDFGLDGLLFAVWDYGSPHDAIDSFFLVTTLQDSHDCGFVYRASRGDAPLLDINVHVACFPADECFVCFALAREHIESARFQSVADTVSHEPSGLLGDPQIAGQFTGANAVLAVHHKPESREPLFQRDRRVFKDRASLQRELGNRMPGVAFPDAILGKVSDLLRATMRTFHLAIGPAQEHHERLAVLEVAEVDYGFM